MKDIDLIELKNLLTIPEIISIIQNFIPDLIYEEHEEFLVLPTICHNLEQEEGSLKLYYYNNTKLFFCYTQCGSSFDIYELLKKMMYLRGTTDKTYNFNNVLKIIFDKSTINFSFKETNNQYVSILDKYQKQSKIINFKSYSENILKCFQNVYYSGWIDDGISITSMKRYGIKYSISKEQIIIPHYDINNNLIGIRARNLKEEDILKGKYMPIISEGIVYSHPLSYNLYGININKEAIKKYKRAYIFEGEKSVMIMDTWYHQENVSVASCGNKINIVQIKLLLSLGVNDIIICYDRMNYDLKTDKEYFNNLYKICSKYKNYANFSFIFDRKGLVNYKDAPVDKGQEIFEKLLKERVII